MEFNARFWFRIHSWLGLNLSIFMSFILLTGTLAVFSYEMDWLLNKEMRVAPQSAEARVSWGTLYQSARDAYPTGRLQRMQILDDPWWAVEAIFTDHTGQLQRIWLNPYTGEYQGYTSWFNLQRFFRQTHRHLMLPTAIGVPIVASLAFPLILALISGLVFYKKFWRGFFKWPRFEKNPRVWLGDLHRLIALWSLWFVLLIALTSVWYFVEKLGGDAPRMPKPSISDYDQYSFVTPLSKESIDNAVAVAREQFPELTISRLSLPQNPGDSIQLFGQAKALLVRMRANSVAIDPASNVPTGIVDGTLLSIHQRISEMADPLHFGTWGGLVSRIIWFVFGVALTGLSITGVYIYGLRVRSMSETVNIGPLTAAWRQMGRWRWVCIALITISVLLTPSALRHFPQRVEQGEKHIGGFGLKLETKGFVKSNGSQRKLRLSSLFF